MEDTASAVVGTGTSKASVGGGKVVQHAAGNPSQWEVQQQEMPLGTASLPVLAWNTGPECDVTGRGPEPSSNAFAGSDVFRSVD